MVFEGVVSSLLNKYLGEFVENLDSSQLSISIFSGCVELNNLRLKSSALDNFGLPLKVKSGMLGKLFLNIPWQSLYTSATEVVVENLYINAYLDSNITIHDHEILKQKLKMTSLENMESMFSIKLLSSASSNIDDRKNNKEKPQSYIEKIGALIVRNLLVTLKNINIIFEQNETDELFKPFYYGIHLESLTALTTDNHYKPCFSNEITPLIYKLIKLDSTSMYWLPEKCQFSYENIGQTIEKLSKVDYILRLDDIYLKACLNTDPSHNFKIPSIGVILNLQTISMTFNAEMFTSTINMINRYTNKKLKLLYSQYKPKIPMKNKAREYWEYAINVILNQYIEPKTSTWNWKYIKNYSPPLPGKQAAEYQSLYIKLLRKDKNVTAKDLEKYEVSLNLMTLFLCRHLARLIVKKDIETSSKTSKVIKQHAPPTSSWFSRLFGSTNSSASRSAIKTSTASFDTFDSSMEVYLGLTEEEQKEQLNKVLDVVGHSIVDESKLPQDFIKISLSVILDEFEWVIKKNRVDSLLMFKMKTFSSDFSMFANKPGSIRLSATVYDMNILALRNCGFEFDVFKIIESSVSTGSSENIKSPLLNMVYSAFPPDRPDIDHKFNLVTKKSQINIDLVFINEFIDIVYSLPKIDQWERFKVTGVDKSKYPTNRSTDSRSSTSWNDTGGDKFDISVDACVSAIHICEDFVSDSCDIIVLNLGYVCLLTKPSQSILKCKQFMEDYSLINQRKLMQQFDFTLTNVSIRVVKNIPSYSQHQSSVSSRIMNTDDFYVQDDSGKQLLVTTTSSFNDKTNYILTPFTIESEISAYINNYCNDSANQPQLLILTLVNHTYLMLSTSKIVSIYKVVDSFLSIINRVSQNKPIDSLDYKLEIFESADNDMLYNSSNLDDFLYLQSTLPTATTTPEDSSGAVGERNQRKISTSRSEISLDSRKSLTSNRRSIQLHLIAPNVKITFFYKDYANNVSDISFNFSDNSCEFIGQTLDYSISFSTNKAVIEHNQSNRSSIIFNVDDGLLLDYRLCLLPSIVEQAFHNHELSQKQIDKAKSVYEEFYDSVQHIVDIRWGTLNFVCCYEIVQSMRSAFKNLAKSLNYEIIHRDQQKSDSNKLENNSRLNLISSNVLQGNDSANIDKKSKYDLSTKLAAINIHVESVALTISYSQYEIAHIIFKQWFCDICYFSNSDIQLSCNLDDLSVWDLSYPETKFKKIVSVDGGKLFNLKLFVDNKKFKNHIPPAAIIDLKVAQLTLVFIYRFINDMLEWSNCLVQKKHLIQATEQAITDFTNIAKHQVVVQHTFIQMNIDIGAPIVVVPFKSDKLCVVIADFGHIYIHNSFVDKDNQSAAICERYTIDLEHINVSRAIYGGDGNKISKKQNILDPLDISLTLVRHLGDEKFNISLCIINELINLSLSPQDFLALVRLFVENFNEKSPHTSLATTSVDVFPVLSNDSLNNSTITIEDTNQSVSKSIASANFVEGTLSSREKKDAFLISISIVISKVNMSLFHIGDFNDTIDYSNNVIQRCNGSLFARLSAVDFQLKLHYNSNGDLSLDIELPQFTVFDSRSSTPDIRQRVVFSDLNTILINERSNPSQVVLKYIQSHSGRSSLALAINDITLFLNASYLKLLYDSFITPLFIVTTGNSEQNEEKQSSEFAQDIVVVDSGNRDNNELINLPSDEHHNDDDDDISANTLDITELNPPISTSSNIKFVLTVDLRSSRLILCATDSTEHALFSQMIGNFTYESKNKKVSMSAKVKNLSVDCAKFCGSWHSNSNYCQVVRMDNSFVSIIYDGKFITGSTVEIDSFLANIAPPTLMAILSIKDTLLSQSSNESEPDSTPSSSTQLKPKLESHSQNEPSNNSIENIEFVHLWTVQPINKNNWYLRDIPSSDLVIGTTAWVRLSDLTYHKLILTKIVVNMLHFQSLDSKTNVVVPREDSLAVLPDLALTKPKLLSDVSVGNLVLVDCYEYPSKDSTNRTLGEVIQVQLLNNKLLKVQIFFYSTDTRIWLSQNEIYVIPKSFVRSYPGVYSPVYVRCYDGQYRMGTIQSVLNMGIHFSIFNKKFNKSFAYITDTAAWAYPWKKVSYIISTFKQDIINQSLIGNVLLSSSVENSTVYEPVYVISIVGYPLAKVRFLVSRKINIIDISQCIIVDKQKGHKFGLGSRWLVMTDDNHYEEYILNKKLKQMLTFGRNKIERSKIFGLSQKTLFLVDCELAEETMDCDSDVLVLEDAETGIYVRGKIVKKSYWINSPEYKIKLYDGRYLLRCPLRNIRQRYQRISSVRSTARSSSFVGCEKIHSDYTPKVSFKINTINFVIEGMINDKIVPLLHLGSNIQGSAFNIKSKNFNLQLEFSLFSSYFNSKCGEWEPLIELIERNGSLVPWICQLEYSSLADNLTSNNNIRLSSTSNIDLLIPNDEDILNKAIISSNNNHSFDTSQKNISIQNESVGMACESHNVYDRYLKFKSSQRLEFTITNKTIETLYLANYLFSGENVMKNEYSFLRNNFVIVNSLGLKISVVPNNFFTTANQNHTVLTTLELYPVHPYMFNQKLSQIIVPQLSISIPGFKPLDSISIISNNSFQLMLHPDELSSSRSLSEVPSTLSNTTTFPSIVFDIKSEKGSKIINLRSILKIRNMLNHSVDVEIFTDKDKMFSDDRNAFNMKLKKDCSSSCSFNQLSNSSYLTLQPAFSSKKVRISFQKLVDHFEKMISCLAMTFEESNDFYIMLKLDRDYESRPARTISHISKTPLVPLVLCILPPIVVYNHIPYMLVLSFVPDFSFPITVSDVASIYNINLNQFNQILYIKVCGYFSINWYGKVVLSASNRNKCLQVEFVSESANNLSKKGSTQMFKFCKQREKLPLYLNVNIKFSNNLVIDIYSPVYVMNNCSVSIKLRVSRLAESWMYEVPANNLLLLRYQSKDYKASIKFDNSKWSKEFSMNAVGNRATLTCPNKSGSAEYKVSMKITTTDYYATKCIKFKPFYLLENNLDVDIDILHSGNKSVHLEPSSTHFFWPTNKFPMELNIKFRGEIIHSFYPQPDESVVVKLIDKKLNKYDTIVVNTSQQDYSTKIIFNNYYEGCAPVLMVNACSQTDRTIYFKQKDAFQAYPLLSGYRIFYTWENYKNPLDIICCFDSNFENSFQINVKKSEYGQVMDNNLLIYYATFLDGLQRVCLFSDDLRYIWRAVQESHSLSTMNLIVDIEGVGLSLVSLDANIEVLYLNIQSNHPYWQYMESLASVTSGDEERWKMFSHSTSNLIEHYYGFYEQAAMVLDNDFPKNLQQDTTSNYDEVLRMSSSDHKSDNSNEDTSNIIQPKNEDLCKGLIALSNRKRVNFSEMYLLDGTDKRYSIRRVTYSGLEFCVVLSENFDIKAIDLNIFNLQIDNPSMSSNFPVVCAPTPLKETVDISKSVQQHIIRFSMQLRPPRIFGDRRIIHVDSCILLVQEFNLNVDLGFVNKLSHFITSVTENPDQEATSEAISKQSLASITDGAHQINRKKSVLSATSTSIGVKKSSNSKHDDAVRRYSQTFFIFDTLHLSPLKIIVAFSTTATTDPNEKTSNESSFIVQTILSLIPFVDVCDIPFRLSCFEMTSCNKLVSLSELRKQITEHYTFQILRQAFVLVLGLEVIGNPFNFVTELASGTKNLFYEPYMGSIQGADQFARGLGIGLRSFASGTFGNAAGVLSKVTNSLGTGLAILSFDSQHQLSRRSIKRIKPQNLQEGMSQGGIGFVRGIISGISGIVTKPIEGAINEGAEGFFKGVGKGIAGAFVKPVGGVIDFASSTLAGIKGGIKGSSIVRVYRLERAFYASGVLHNYLKSDASGYHLFQKILKSNPGEYGGFVKCVSLSNLFLMLTEWYLFTVEVDNILDTCTIIRSYDVTYISSIECVNNVIRFNYLLKKNNGPLEFIFKNKNQANLFYNNLLVVISWL